MSTSYTMKMSSLPQQCHQTKPLSLKFQDQDSCSTQSTGKSYPEVGSAQSGIAIEILSISVFLTLLINCMLLILSVLGISILL